MWQRLLQFGYNGLFITVFTFTWPYFLWRLRKRGHLWKEFGSRLGWYNKEQRRKLGRENDLWIHAVSVGEVMLASVLIYHLRQNRSQLRIVLSTTTATGYKMAQKMESESISVIYNPIDFHGSVAKAFRLIRPKVLLLIEAEIWPNYLWVAKKRKVPVYLVNARLSPKSESRYRQFRWLIRPVLQNLNLVFTQHDTDIERLVGAGFPPESIFSVGSLKYDVADLPESETRTISSWWANIGWTDQEVILLGGSTHPGEEEILVRIFNRLRKEFPGLRLILAPRDAERGIAVRDMCLANGLHSILRSDLQNPVETSPHILVLNTTGELRSVYREADIVFIGKSLRSKGGQNFIEAARVGSAIILGPNMQNFEHLLNEFLRHDGIIQITDEFSLAQRIRELLISPEKRQEYGKRAQTIFLANLGAGKKTAEIVTQSLALTQN